MWARMTAGAGSSGMAELSWLFKQVGAAFPFPSSMYALFPHGLFRSSMLYCESDSVFCGPRGTDLKTA